MANRIGKRAFALAIAFSQIIAIQCLVNSTIKDPQGRRKACDVLIGIDQTLWEQNDKNITVLVQLAKDHVRGLNKLFSEQVFIEDFNAYYFNLNRVEIVFGSCEGHAFEENYEKNCTEQREAYLKAYDESTDTSDFCLAFLLTFLDFHNGTAGLASIGTVCRKTYNSGFVTLLNFGQERDLDESILTFAHEVAHTFNSTHDNLFNETEPDCYNQGFIMDELYNSTSGENQGKFSPCSLRSMKAKLETLGADDCFRDLAYDEEFSELEIAQCGNLIVEPGEQCDCGFDQIECNDPCCYPAVISASERAANASAKSCQRNQRSRCITPSGILYGFYLPWAVILFMVVILSVVLYRDWHREKKLFVILPNAKITSR